MATKKATKLKTPVGTPIYDDLGRVIGFSGIDPVKGLQTANGTKSYGELVRDDAYQNSSFARGVNAYAANQQNYKPVPDVVPHSWREQQYEDGSSEFVSPTKDMYTLPDKIPTEAQIQAVSVKPLNRKFTKQYAPPEEQAQAGQSKQVAYQNALGNNKGGMVPAAVQPAQLPASGTSWEQFVEQAKQVAAETGYPLSVLLGQAAIETGRKHSPGNNYFGVKGSGNAGSQNLATKEAGSDGNLYGTNGNFAAYAKPGDSIRAYVNLIKNKYPNAWNSRGNPLKMVQAIKAGGYATDPDYVSKVTGTPEFRQFQNFAPPPPPRVSVPPPRPGLGFSPTPTPTSGQIKFNAAPPKQAFVAPIPKQQIVKNTPPPLQHQKAQTGAIGQGVQNLIGGVKKLFGR